jgi:hypothetical protein
LLRYRNSSNGREPTKPKKEKAQPMSEPNPVKAYVNVIPQGGEGRDTAFILCEHSEKGVKSQYAQKAFGSIQQSVPSSGGYCQKSNSQTDY